MRLFKIYEIGNDWYAEGTLISSHKTKESAEKRLNKEFKKRVKTLNYVRANFMDEHTTVYDYGLWNRFMKLIAVEDDKT